MLTAVEKTAFRRKPCLNGMCLVKPKYTAITTIASNTTAKRTGLERRCSSTTGVVVATAPAQAAHPPSPSLADAKPRSFSVAVGYFSPNRFCSRVVSSRLVAVLPAGRLPITALPAM